MGEAIQVEKCVQNTVCMMGPGVEKGGEGVVFIRASNFSGIITLFIKREICFRQKIYMILYP